MTHNLIITADAVRARFFSQASGRRNSHLVERTTLVNPALEQPSGDRYRGRRRGARGDVMGHFYTVDDHRLRHDESIAKRFAGRVTEEAVRLAKELGTARVLLIADPRTLGRLRDARDFRADGLDIRGIAREVTRLSVSELETYLHEEGLLPAA